MRVVRQFDRSWRQRWIAVFAALLIAGLGFVQFVHLHEELAPSGTAHSHCALCVLSHSPAVVTAARSAPAPLSDFVQLASADPQLHPRLLITSSFIRPPPSV